MTGKKGWTIYHNPRCSKSRAALALIQGQGDAVQVIEYLRHPPSETELEEILDLLGVEPIEIVRRGEAKFKELSLAGRQLSRAEWVEVLVAHPRLLERPIVLREGRAVIGRPTERVLQLADSTD